MLRASIGFFIVGLIAFGIGAGNIGGLSVEIGKTLLYVFLFLSVASLLISLFTGGSKHTMKSLAFMTAATVLGTGMMMTTNVSAEETTAEKIQNEVDEAATDAKIAVRKKKKDVRDATGNSSLIEDAKDEVENIKDRTQSETRQMKRKLD
jgi:uncharacterized membrane protein YtjA (UPF0391 family)